MSPLRPCPVSVDLYNKHMGGVDMADAMRRVLKSHKYHNHKNLVNKKVTYMHAYRYVNIWI